MCARTILSHSHTTILSNTFNCLLAYLISTYISQHNLFVIAVYHTYFIIWDTYHSANLFTIIEGYSTMSWDNNTSLCTYHIYLLQGLLSTSEYEVHIHQLSICQKHIPNTAVYSFTTVPEILSVTLSNIIPHYNYPLYIPS